VGVYRERVLPRIVDRTCGMRAHDGMRLRVCEGLRGRVLEIGFGSGRNVPFYPAAVERVDAVEPAEIGWRLARDRVAGAAVPVTRVGLDGQALTATDGSYDCVLSTWTLCSIPDLAAALAEVRRVLRPGGTLHFVEHGLAPDVAVQVWQRRLEPLQKRLFGGCHLTRSVVEVLTTAGFEVGPVEQFYEPGAPRAYAAMTLGRATAPRSGGRPRPAAGLRAGPA